MWNRKELKKTGKSRFLAHYWKGVLVALILTIALGGYNVISNKSDIKSSKHSNVTVINDYEELRDFVNDASENGLGKAIQNANEISDEDAKEIDQAVEMFNENKTVIVPMIAATAFGIFLVITLLSAGLGIFLFNPVEVGTRRYFVKNETEDASLKEMGVAFSNSYINLVKIMFLKDLFIFLWALLFIIPGIIKAYEYRMIPFLLAEDPTMSTDEAFEKSKKMMSGNKWRAFVLDLSFIGWGILSGLTAGLLGLFFVNPYMYQTQAALYNALKDNDIIEAAPENYESYIEVE